MRHAVLTPFFGQLRDRFGVYHEPRSTHEKIAAAAAIDGVDGIEIIFPDEVDDPDQIQEALELHGLEVAAVNVNLKGERRFQHGALSSPDRAVRARAVDLLCAGKRLAVALDAPRITCAPLADGYDYALQVDYRHAWSRMVDSLSRAAAYLPDVTMHVEHKPAEPRTRGLLDVPAKILLLCRDIGLPGVGITFNVGHAQCGNGLPACALADVMHAGLPYYLHVCDAARGWDWDLRVGSPHLWQWAECLFYLKRDGYEGWLTADTFPVRQDARSLHASNITITRAICDWLDRLDTASLEDGLSRHDASHMLRELEQCLPPRS